MSKEIPVFSGSEIERIKKCVKWVKKNVKLKRWPDKRVEKEWSVRTPKQVLESGQTFYMGNCLDRTTVFLEVLKKNNFSPTMVLQILNHKRYGEFLHFAVEFKAGGKTHFADFVGGDKVIIKQGEYKNHNPLIESIKVQRFPGKKFSMNKNFWESTGKNPMEHGAKNFSIKKRIEGMKKDNKVARYYGFKAVSAFGNLAGRVKARKKPI